MAYIRTPSEFDIFHAIRTGNWEPLAQVVSELSKAALERHKQPSEFGSYGYRRRGSDKGNLLHLPLYPWQGLVAMRHEEGSTKLLNALKKDTFIKRMDCSKVVMHFVKNDIDGLVWLLKNGWGSHLGLMQSRQQEMSWFEMRQSLKTQEQKDTIDSWVRQWTKKSPGMLQVLTTPTREECKEMILGQDYVSDRVLNVLYKEDDVRSFLTTMEGLGTWSDTLSVSSKLAILQPFFANKPTVEMSLPDNFEIEP